MHVLLDQIRELWAERRRIALVGLGVIWGTLSLTLLLSTGAEMQRASSQTMDNFGVNLFRIGGGSTTMPFQGFAAGRGIGLQPEDADALRAAVPDLLGVSSEYSSGGSNPVRYGDVQINARLAGVEPTFEKLRGQIPELGGRFINPLDFAEHRRVCFLGERIKATLFGEKEAVGEFIELHGVPYLVIGVRQARMTSASYNGEDRDKILIPGTSFHDLLGWNSISFLVVALENPAHKKRILGQIYHVLGRRHGFDPVDEGALDAQDYMAISDMVDSILDGNRIFTALVGLLGLLVAAIGVANVMYAMVEERTREIGIQMALGARPKMIARDRLIEGLVVTLGGGMLGIAVCAGLLAVLNILPMGPDARGYLGYPSVSLITGGIVTVLLGLAGCLAAWFPAKAAAALQPVETLREE